MSVQAISWALSIKGITPPEKLILLAVANYADADGLCWPSQATLARDTCLSTRTIVRLFSALESAVLCPENGARDALTEPERVHLSAFICIVTRCHLDGASQVTRCHLT